MKIVDIRIDHYENSFEYHNQPSNYTSRIKRKLKEFGREFVLVPADKASNNIIVV